MIYTNEGLVNHVKMALKLKTKYMWAGTLNPITDAYINQKVRQCEEYGVPSSHSGYTDARIRQLHEIADKGYKLAIWLAENIAYDMYRANNLRWSRAGTVDIYDGTYSVWNLKTGVCFDFANIYAIMCRQQGIACTTIGSDSQDHMWNLVRINGRWMELDISRMAKYKTFKKDATVRTKVGLNLDYA